MPYNDNERFRGREELLSEIAQALDPRPESASAEDAVRLRSFAITGHGGMGKSQAAAKYVHRRKQTFDAIFWVLADTRSKLYGSFKSIAVTLGLVDDDTAAAQDEVLTREMVLGWLAQPLKSYRQRENEQVSEATWLLVFDNVEDDSLLDDFWPRASSGAILVTSRIKLQSLRLPSSGHGAKIPPFGPEETAAFLLDITDRNNSEEDRATVDLVAERLGNIPLAVAQMAGTILRRNLTFAEFLAEYENAELRKLFLTQHVDNRGEQRYEHNLLSVWGFDKLKYGAGLLDVLAFLDPDGVPEHILRDNRASLEMRNFPQLSTDYVKASTELLDSSLVSRDRSKKSIVIHRLIQETVRANLDPTRYSEVFVSTLQLLSGVWPYEEEFGFIKDETKRWRKCNELYKQVMCLEKLREGLDPPTVFSKAHVQPPKLVLECAWYVSLLSGRHCSQSCNRVSVSLLISATGSASCVPRSEERL